MKVEVHYRGRLVWNYDSPTPEEAKARAERAGHRVSAVLVGKDGVVRISSEKPSGYVEVSSKETSAICAAKQAEGVAIFNGCTHVWLNEKYGTDNTLHVMGVGYFRKSKRGRKS